MTVAWETYISELPELVEEDEIDYNVIKTQFENKKAQYALKSTTPVQSWRLKWGVLEEDDVNKIWEFYQNRHGRYESFYWNHPYQQTTLSAAGGSETHVHVTTNLRVLPGDTVLIDGTAYTVVSADTTAKTITLTGTCDKANGSTIQIRYKVRFGTPLTLDLIKSWLTSIGLTFERDLG